MVYRSPPIAPLSADLTIILPELLRYYSRIERCKLPDVIIGLIKILQLIFQLTIYPLQFVEQTALFLPRAYAFSNS